MNELIFNLISVKAFLLLGLVVNLICIGWLVKTELRFKKLFMGKNGASLENIITKIAEDLNASKKKSVDIDTYLVGVERRLRRSIQGLETTRFKAFNDFGGNQNFASAFIDEEGNGLIISSLYARDHFSIFAKPIKNYKSEHELTDEEKNVLTKAKDKTAI